MKKFLKTFVVLATLAFLSSSVIACSDNDDDSSSGETPASVTTYCASYTRADKTATGTITFYNDNTFIYHFKEIKIENGFSTITDVDWITGTYTGNPAKDGTFKMKMLKSVKDFEDMTPAEKEPLLAKVIEAAKKGETSYTFTNKDFPLLALPSSEQEEETITVTNGKFTIESDTYEDYGVFLVEFKRQ